MPSSYAWFEGKYVDEIDVHTKTEVSWTGDKSKMYVDYRRFGNLIGWLISSFVLLT